MRHIGIMNMNTEKEFRILLIDDHELTINTLTAYFINTKYAVDTVTDRYSALTKIKNNTYDLIFVDFTLPGIKEPLIVNSLQKISSETRIIIITKNAVEPLDGEENLDFLLGDARHEPRGIFDHIESGIFRRGLA